jgi:hypothetical protein
MAPHHISYDDVELNALDRLAAAAPAGPTLAMLPLFAARRWPILDSAIRNGE